MKNVEKKLVLSRISEIREVVEFLDFANIVEGLINDEI